MEPPSSTIDVAQLDVGDYPVAPRAPLGVAGTAAEGAVVEGQRMADYVVGPWEVDPRLVDGGFQLALSGDGYETSAGVRLLPDDGKDPAAIPWVTSEQSTAISQRHDFVIGFFTNRKGLDDSNFQIQNVVLRFGDEAAAAAAAAEIGDALRGVTDVGPVTPVSVPGYPDAVASTHQVDNSDDIVVLPGFGTDDDIRRYTSVRSALAHGDYVLMQEVRSPDGIHPALALLVRALDLQAPLIDQFAAADANALADVARDPSGLLARTLPVAPEDYGVDQRAVAVFAPRGALHFASDPVRRATALSDSGVDQVANGKTTVYQARDASAAAQLVVAINSEVDADRQPTTPIPGMEASRCFRTGHNDMTHCVAAADRYVVDATSISLRDAQQLVAAQVAMLL